MENEEKYAIGKIDWILCETCLYHNGIHCIVPFDRWKEYLEISSNGSNLICGYRKMKDKKK